jgi:hypothetical protein
LDKRIQRFTEQFFDNKNSTKKTLASIIEVTSPVTSPKTNKVIYFTIMLIISSTSDRKKDDRRGTPGLE